MKRSAKKSTWFNDLQDMSRRLDRRLQQRTVTPATRDDTWRECSNCGQEYTGRLCPQCGQAGNWKRYTWRQAFLNFLDIWGLGNRPMFRTLQELLIRPGYMIRDYLNGHRQYYFPPFKLLAVSVILLLFVSWLTGIEVESFFRSINIGKWKSLDASFEGVPLAISTAFMWLSKFLSGNLLYEWLFLGILLLVCVWFGFKSVSRYNFVETYIFLIFVIAQLTFCQIADTLVVAGCNFLTNHLTLQLYGKSILVQPVAGYVEVIADRIQTTMTMLVLLLLFIDFRQFYNLSWKTTFSHIVSSITVGIVFFLMVVVIVMGYVIDKVASGYTMMVAIAIVSLGFAIVKHFLRKNKSEIPSVVAWMSKLSIWSVVAIVGYVDLPPSAGLFKSIGWWLISVGLSLLPIFLYRKYHKKWMAVLPTILLIVLTIIVLKGGYQLA